MGIFAVILLAVGLSFDTFAVSVSTGVSINQIRFWQGVKIAIVLAVFQGLMPFLGYLGGIQIEKYISQYDHWVAFVLLFGLGIKMIYDSTQSEKENKNNPLHLPVLLGIALATSIDALVVGVSFALIPVNIWLAVITIGGITFFSAMTGMLVGKNVSGKFGSKVEIFGGLILMSIGLKTLVFHMFP